MDFLPTYNQSITPPFTTTKKRHSRPSLTSFYSSSSSSSPSSSFTSHCSSPSPSQQPDSPLPASLSSLLSKLSSLHARHAALTRQLRRAERHAANQGWLLFRLDAREQHQDAEARARGDVAGPPFRGLPTLRQRLQIAKLELEAAQTRVAELALRVAGVQVAVQDHLRLLWRALREWEAVRRRGRQEDRGGDGGGKAGGENRTASVETAYRLPSETSPLAPLVGDDEVQPPLVERIRLLLDQASFGEIMEVQAIIASRFPRGLKYSAADMGVMSGDESQLKIPGQFGQYF